MKTKRRPHLAAIASVGALAIASCSSGDSEAEPCAAAQDVADAFIVGTDASTLDEANVALDQLADSLTDFADAAPSEIKDDAELLAENTRLLADSDSETPTEEELAAITSAEYNTATENFSNYVEDNCGITIG